MFKLKDLLGILSFQLNREIVSLAKIALELLEMERNKRLRLEKTLEHLGFDDKELLSAEEDYKYNRKLVWDKFNEKERELQKLVNRFDIEQV